MQVKHKSSIHEPFKRLQDTGFVHKQLQPEPLNMHLEHHSTDRCQPVRGTYWSQDDHLGIKCSLTVIRPLIELMRNNYMTTYCSST